MREGQDRSTRERGASAVEFALVTSLLFMLLFGTIQFGIAYNRHQGLQAAAREGARVASVGGSEDEIRSRVYATQSLFTDSDIEIAIDYSLNDGDTWPGHQMICDDATSTGCTADSPPPCAVAGIGNLIRVSTTVDDPDYAITIPAWGQHEIQYHSAGVFRCENS